MCIQIIKIRVIAHNGTTISTTKYTLPKIYDNSLSLADVDDKLWAFVFTSTWAYVVKADKVRDIIVPQNILLFQTRRVYTMRANFKPNTVKQSMGARSLGLPDSVIKKVHGPGQNLHCFYFIRPKERSWISTHPDIWNPGNPDGPQ